MERNNERFYTRFHNIVNEWSYNNQGTGMVSLKSVEKFFCMLEAYFPNEFQPLIDNLTDRLNHTTKKMKKIKKKQMDKCIKKYSNFITCFSMAGVKKELSFKSVTNSLGICYIIAAVLYFDKSAEKLLVGLNEHLRIFVGDDSFYKVGWIN